MTVLAAVLQVCARQGYLVVGYNSAQRLGTSLPPLKDGNGIIIFGTPSFKISSKASRWDARQQVALLEKLVGKELPRQPKFKFWYRAVREEKL